MRFTELFANIRSKFSSNSVSGRIVVKDTEQYRRVRNGNGSSRIHLLTRKARSCAELQFKQKYSESGWLVRAHLADHRFANSALANRRVKFLQRDEQNKPREFSGLFQPLDQQGVLFTLEGREEIFNANMIGVLAVEPD